MATEPAPRNWWRRGTVYQVWPASYKDSTGSGLGDIRGVISTLPHLSDLGVDIVWMSPMYDSPQKDYGYDISDFTKVYPPYGTNEDMFELIEKCHERGIKVILDLVMNHTSDEHSWFKESRSSRDNDKADWYIWRDGKVDPKTGKVGPPNNWRSIFEGSVWEWCEQRQQYYFHLFAPGQPDLNWENPEVRKAVYRDAINFWMDHGVDGFRVDAVNLMSKDQTFQDAEITEPDVFEQIARTHFTNGPKMHEWLQEMHRESIDKHGDVMLVGELAASNAEKTLEYVSGDSKELSMVFDSSVVDIQRHDRPMWEVGIPALSEVKTGFQKQQDFLAGTSAWTTIFMENHDQPRSINRFLTSDPAHHNKAGRLLAILSGTLSGTLFVYQGQEIGMTNFPSHWDESHLRDPADIHKLRLIEQRYPGDQSRYNQALGGLKYLGRDNARTPVQWDSSANAGFTTGKPWIDINENYASINVKDQETDPDSILSTWKHILQLRRQYEDALVFGSFEVHDPEDEKVFMYTKSYKGKPDIMVVLNWTAEEQEFRFPESIEGKRLTTLIANVGAKDMVSGRLAPFEARVLLMED